MWRGYCFNGRLYICRCVSAHRLKTLLINNWCSSVWVSLEFSDQIFAIFVQYRAIFLYFYASQLCKISIRRAANAATVRSSMSRWDVLGRSWTHTEKVSRAGIHGRQCAVLVGHGHGFRAFSRRCTDAVMVPSTSQNVVFILKQFTVLQLEVSEVSERILLTSAKWPLLKLLINNNRPHL